MEKKKSLKILNVQCIIIIIIMLKIKVGFKISQLEERESQSSNELPLILAL